MTDGADYQYDTTYQFNDGPDLFPGMSDWIQRASPSPTSCSP